MRKMIPVIRPMGERSVLIEFEPQVNEKTLQKVLFCKKILKQKLIKPQVEVINTYFSLLVIYTYSIENIYNEVLAIKKTLLNSGAPKLGAKQLYHVPVCYDAEFGLDLEMVSKENHLSVAQIIALHTHPIYTVYFIGFLPGFLYLGGLDEKLHISRRNRPRLEVQKGAVGIGGNQTGIYPKSSPGGWQLIGNSPVLLFDPGSLPPCEISAGDKVKFYPVTREEHSRITAAVDANEFQFRKEKL